MNDAAQNTLDDGHPFEPAQRLAELMAEGGSVPRDDVPNRLALHEIIEMPDLFQMRGMSDRHVSDLVRAIQNVGELDPVTVVQVGAKAILIDGHHRLAAYRQAKRMTGIPVRYFSGTLEEALLEAGQANSKAKLPMTSQERQNCAWRLVLLGKHSKAQIGKASGVSTSQIGNMREVMKKLSVEAFECRAWWQARERARGKGYEMTDDEREQWKQELAERFADQLAKMFSTKLAQHPEIAAMALATYFGRRLPEVVRELHQHAPELDEDENSDF